MIKVIARTPKVRTVADLLKRLGDIPPERVWFRPVPGTATEQDVLNIEAHQNRLCELVDGVLVEKTVGVHLVWLIDPATRTAEVYTGARKKTTITAAESLDGGTVLPGFRLNLQKLFTRAGRRRNR
jgi:hypothetical protein